MARIAPERSCLGCRKVKEKSNLLRFVVAPDMTLVPDILAKLPGRGAYTCVNRHCLKEALRKNQFSRAFKVSLTISDSGTFIEDIAAKLEERIASYISLANKAGRVVSGTDMVAESIKRNQVGLVIVARDVSAEIGKKIDFLAARALIPCFHAFTRDRFGSMLGKGLRSAVAIQSGDFVAVVMKEIERFRKFSEEGAHE